MKPFDPRTVSSIAVAGTSEVATRSRDGRAIAAPRVDTAVGVKLLAPPQDSVVFHCNACRSRVFGTRPVLTSTAVARSAKSTPLPNAGIEFANDAARPLLWLAARLGAAEDQFHASASMTGFDLLGPLAEAAGDPSLTIPEFLVLASVFEAIVQRPTLWRPPDVLDAVMTTVPHAADPVSERPTATVRRLIEELDSGRRPTQASVASHLAMNSAHCGRLLRSDTGLSFRQWRTALSVKRGLNSLMQSDEFISQIAYQLGYDHPSQFTREFYCLLGISPRPCRRLLASCRCQHELRSAVNRRVTAPTMRIPQSTVADS